MTGSSSSRKESAKTQSEACAFEIMSLIRGGEYGPGAKLSEYLLSARLGYGLSPVKMALNGLAESGILERRPRSGTYVRNISMNEYVDLLEVRIRLEGLSALQATNNLTPTQLNQLEKLARESDASREIKSEDSKQRLAAVRKDTDFHMSIARASRNTALIEILDRHHLLSLCFLYALQVSPQPSRQILAGVTHVDIVKAFKKRDARQAEMLMQRHIGRIKEFLS
jgi:DNA-binding GntR family transcriptional regulator